MSFCTNVAYLHYTINDQAFCQLTRRIRNDLIPCRGRHLALSNCRWKLCQAVVGRRVGGRQRCQRFQRHQFDLKIIRNNFKDSNFCQCGAHYNSQFKWTFPGPDSSRKFPGWNDFMLGTFFIRLGPCLILFFCLFDSTFNSKIMFNNSYRCVTGL